MALNSQKKGATNPSVGVIRAGGPLWGPASSHLPSGALVLGHRGARGVQVAPNWVPLVLDPLGGCSEVNEGHPGLCSIYSS